MSASVLLEVQSLRAGYGRVPILHGIDLTVHDGEIVGILGHNGMGKSTLLKTLIGLVPASGGSVHFEGIDITGEPSHERAQLGIGYVPQGRGIFPMLSVFDNLRMGVAAHADDDEDAVRNILADFPRLERLLDREGGALSGGEQQLLALARCLISEPQLVLLDEPTEGIQPSIIDEIIDLLKDLRRKRGITIVLVEQNLEFITELSDRVLLLQKGEITGEVAGGDATNAELVEEFVGFGTQRATATSSPSAATAPRPAPTVSARPAPFTATSAPVPPPQPARVPSQRSAPHADFSQHESHSYMTVQRPTHAQLREIVEDFGMHMSDQRISEFMAVMNDTIGAYDVVDAMPHYLPPVDYPRTSVYRPTQ